MVGQAFSFDGADDLVEVPDAPSLSFNTNSPLSVDLWAFRTGTNQVMHLIGKRADCVADLNYQIGLNTENGEGLGFGAGLGNEVATGIDLPLNAWTHLTGTFDGTTYQFYMNGQLVATSEGTLGEPNPAPFLIGGSGSCTTFAGLIDEVSIYNRALTAEESQVIFNAGSAGKCKGVPLTPVAAQATLSVGASGGADTFTLQTTFILGDGSNGITPLTEAVALQVGTTSLTIPADAFHSPSDGVFAFAGVVEGVTLQVTLTRRTRATFEVVAHGEGATLSGIAVPVKVGLAIGDDSGSITLPMAEVSARTPPLQR
jgi:hypothetical protein